MAQFSSTVSDVKKNTVVKKYLFLGLWCAVIVLSLCACQAGIYHTVKPGQTLYRIGHTYNVNEAYLARVNGIHNPTQIRIGTKIFIPGAKRKLRVPVISSKPTVAKKRLPVKKKRVSTPKPSTKTKYSKPTVAKSKPKKKTTPSKATQVKQLKWPVRGKVVRSFSKNVKAGGGRGIEIAVKNGTGVEAAEAGKVIYSGDGVAGYGYLIILQHENDFFTVYGFNRKNTIKQGDYVSKGERIALSGTPPSGGTPRLHFEVRKGKIAVNPILYLP